MRKIRLWISRHIGFWVPPIGQWEDAPTGYRMRMLQENGEYIYREMTDEEASEYESRRAW